jgi:hypothetical protein
LYNRNALVQRLIEEIAETEWDAATMPELLAMLTEEGVDEENLQLFFSGGCG